jgi:hypothetical protein
VRTGAATFLSVCIALGIGAGIASRSLAAQTAAATPGNQILETEALMELFFQPTYNELTSAIMKKPATKNDWRGIIDASLKLAEIHNLLYSRRGKPFMATPAWVKRVTDSQKLASDIGAIATKLDYPGARKQYEAMAKSCNSCHTEYESEADTVEPYVLIK